MADLPTGSHRSGRIWGRELVPTLLLIPNKRRKLDVQVQEAEDMKLEDRDDNDYMESEDEGDRDITNLEDADIDQQTRPADMVRILVSYGQFLQFLLICGSASKPCSSVGRFSMYSRASILGHSSLDSCNSVLKVLAWLHNSHDQSLLPCIAKGGSTVQEGSGGM